MKKVGLIMFAICFLGTLAPSLALEEDKKGGMDL